MNFSIVAPCRTAPRSWRRSSGSSPRAATRVEPLAEVGGALQVGEEDRDHLALLLPAGPGRAACRRTRRGGTGPGSPPHSSDRRPSPLECRSPALPSRWCAFSAAQAAQPGRHNRLAPRPARMPWPSPGTRSARRAAGGSPASRSRPILANGSRSPESSSTGTFDPRPVRRPVVPALGAPGGCSGYESRTSAATGGPRRAATPPARRTSARRCRAAPAVRAAR